MTETLIRISGRGRGSLTFGSSLGGASVAAWILLQLYGAPGGEDARGWTLAVSALGVCGAAFIAYGVYFRALRLELDGASIRYGRAAKLKEIAVPPLTEVRGIDNDVVGDLLEFYEGDRKLLTVHDNAFAREELRLFFKALSKLNPSIKFDEKVRSWHLSGRPGSESQ